MSIRPTSSVDEPLLDVTSHVTALQMTLRAMQHQHADDDTALVVVNELRSRCDSLASATADAASRLRESHTLDPLLGVPREAEQLAASLITAFLDGVETGGDHQLLSDIVEEIFTRPDTSYRLLAAIMAALARDAATLALHSTQYSATDAMAVLRECLSVPAL